VVERMILGSRLAVVICLVSYGCWLSYIPWKVDQLGIEYDMFGFALLVFGIFSLSSMLFVSHVLLPRFGPRIAGLAVVGFAFALQLWVFAPNTTLFIALAAPYSLAFGVIQPATLAAITQAEAMSGRRLQPLHWASFSGGSLLGLLIGLISQALQLPPVFVFGGLFLLTVIVGIYIFMRLFGTVMFKPIQGPGFRIPSQTVLFLGGLAALSMATISIILDWSALWLTRDLGLTIALGGTGIMAFNLAEIGSRIYGERLINQFGEVLVAGWGMLFGCAIFLAATLSGHPFLIVAGFGALGFFTANFIPVLFGIAAREEVNNPTAAVNDVNLLAFVGFLFGPPLIGYVAKSISISACMIILGVTWALVAAILLASGRLTSSQ
jgi:MFS family permease